MLHRPLSTILFQSTNLVNRQMPFVAKGQDDTVVAAPVANSLDEYSCLECGERVVLRNAHRREGQLVRPHFMHPGEEESCSTGESEEHRWMKALAYVAARKRWPEATIEYEGVVPDAEQREKGRSYLNRVGDRINLDWDAPNANQQKIERKKLDNPRRADVLVRFPEDHPSNDRGLAIECQFRHESKDIEAAVTRFLEFGYSVLLLHQRHFENGVADLENGIWRTRPEPRGQLIELDLPRFSEWHWAVEEHREFPANDDGTGTYLPANYTTACGKQLDEVRDVGNVAYYPRMLVTEIKVDQRCPECQEALLDELGHR